MAVWEKPHCLSVWDWPRYTDLKAYDQPHQTRWACKAYSKALWIHLGSILKKILFLFSISSAFYGYFSTLKHDQGNQGSNTAHGANSACLWAIARPVSANSPPPFHYFSFAPQPAPCCTDPMHFSHVLPVLARLHTKSDLLNLVYYVFISNVFSLGGCVILPILRNNAHGWCYRNKETILKHLTDLLGLTFIWDWTDLTKFII